MADVESKDHGKACPSNSVIYPNVVIERVWVVDDDLVDDVGVDHDAEEKK